MVSPPEGAETLPLGSIASTVPIATPQPNPANLNTLLIKRGLGEDTRDLELEAMRQVSLDLQPSQSWQSDQELRGRQSRPDLPTQPD